MRAQKAACVGPLVGPRLPDGSVLVLGQGGEEERLSVQDTVGAYCRETDERMRKLHQLIDKLQTHLQLQPASN